jgi:HPt (histidine-containing phosphotransfer) domain-containing protein
LLEKIRQDGRLKEMPIVVCSAVSDRDTIVKAASFNIRAYLLKPLSATKVLTTGRRIAEELGVTTPLEDPHAVQLRLGITSTEHHEMLQMLLNETDTALGEIKSDLEQGDKDAALGRISSIRGGCQNLGASGLAASFAKLEKLLATQEAKDIISAVDMIQIDKMHLQEACAALTPAKQSDTDDIPNAAAEDAPGAPSAKDIQPALEDEPGTETPDQESDEPTQEPVEVSQQDDDATTEAVEDAKESATAS